MFAFHLTNTTNNTLFLGGYDGNLVVQYGNKDANTIPWLYSSTVYNQSFNLRMSYMSVEDVNVSTTTATNDLFFEVSSNYITVPLKDYNTFMNAIAL